MERGDKMIYLLLGLLLLAGCDSEEGVSGYVEAVYVDYSSPVSGKLTYRPRYDGETVIAGDLLFSLSLSPEKEKSEKVEAEIERANWVLKDLEKGLRSDDLAYLQANVDGANADLRYWRGYLERLEGLSEDNRSQDELAQATQSLEKAKSVLEASKAKLKSGKLGERSDLILAKRAEIKALKAQAQELDWYLKQKKRNIDFSGRVKQIYYEVGEWVESFRPIMTIEDVNRRYVVFYLNQKELDRVVMGGNVRVSSASGVSARAKIVFISDQAEFTPPIVYTTKQGELYRFMVKAELEASQYLHPGQPVTVKI